ncbi:MAG: PRC-barrel domain-containing protein, partial [Pseudolabrys sp.]
MPKTEGSQASDKQIHSDGSDQEKIGSIERVMIDKISGKVVYAVLSFGGFLGVGENYYPV